MDIGEIQICEVTESVWTSVLGLTVEQRADAKPAESAHVLLTCIHISGAWEGAVMVESSHELARRAASILFGVEEASATDEELRDTVGELTNIIAGNIKGLLPEPSRLSVPAVVEGRDTTFTIMESRLVSAVGFHCEGQPLRVAILKRDSPRG
jgi:chemotaxis protein CheX